MCESSQHTNIIKRVCEASATFCSRLERKALENAAPSVESKSTNAAAGNERESFVLPILDKKGWSINQLALEAELDFHTVNDYLKRKTRPNRSTRKNLADALGIAVDRLPK